MWKKNTGKGREEKNETRTRRGEQLLLQGVVLTFYV